MFWNSKPKYGSAQSVLAAGALKELPLKWYAVAGRHYEAFKRQVPDAYLAAVFTAWLASEQPALAEEAAGHYKEMQSRHIDCLILVGIDA